jgi:hypothetical protein
VLNKRFLDTENIREYELIPGRALMIVIPWHDGEFLNILNIYAPNRAEEHGKNFGKNGPMTHNLPECCTGGLEFC